MRTGSTGIDTYTNN